MKKIFTLIAAALLAVGANAQTKLTLGGQGENGNWSWGWTAVYGADISLHFGSQWGEFNLATTGLTEGATYKLVVAEANEKINLRINGASDADTQYIAVNATELTGTLAAGVTKIELQATEAAQDLHVLSFELNGTQTVYSSNWGVAQYSGKYTTSQWAELYLNGAAAFETQTIAITANEAIPEGALQLKLYLAAPNANGESEEYPEVPAGTNVTIDVNTAVKAISLQAKDAYTIDLASIVSSPIGSASVSTLKAAQQSAQRYNLAGQKVDASYKGVVIENGKKLLVK